MKKFSTLKNAVKILWVVFLLLATSGINAATRYCKASGNWNSTETWTASPRGYLPASVPALGDEVIISRGLIVTVNIADAVCSSIQLGSPTAVSGSGALTFNPGAQLTVGGAVAVGKGAKSGTLNMKSGGKLICNSLETSKFGAFYAGLGTIQLNATNTLPRNLFHTFNNLICSGGTTTAKTGFTAANLSLIGTGKLVLSGPYDYTVTGNLTSTFRTLLSQNIDWVEDGRKLNVGGNFELIGGYNSTVLPLVRLYGAGTKYIRGTGFCFVMLESGDYTCSGHVSFTHQFWAMSNNTSGTFHTGPYSVTATSEDGAFFICNGAVDVGNYGRINVNTIFNGTSVLQSGSLFDGAGTLGINAGGSINVANFYNGTTNASASVATINGILNVSTQFINGYWATPNTSVINVNDGGVINSAVHIVNGYGVSAGAINVSNLGTITAGGLCNGKCPDGAYTSLGILNCTGDATINIRNPKVQQYCWSDFGTFNPGTSNVTFDGTGDGDIIQKTGAKFYNLTINKASGNRIIATTPIHVENSFVLYSGSFSHAGMQPMNVGGNWIQSGTSNYFHSNSLVTFDGVNSVISSTGTGFKDFNNLIINDAATLASTMVVEGSLTINGGKSLSAATYALNIGGDLINNGLFVPGSGVVVFIGRYNQSIGGLSPTTFNRFTLNNTGLRGYGDKVTLLQSITVNKTFNPKQGVLVTGNSSILTMAAGSSATLGSEVSFVDGRMRKIGNSAFTFPLGEISGDEYIWAPIGIDSPADEADSYTAQYFYTSPASVSGSTSGRGAMCDATILHHVSSVEYWELIRDTGSIYPNVTLYWTSGSRSGIQNIEDLTVAHWQSCPASGGAKKWVGLGGAIVGNASSGSITSVVPMESYSPITFGTTSDRNYLPIELLDFAGACVGDEVGLTWHTASEVNNQSFIIENSPDAAVWENIGIVPGAGNSNELLSYVFNSPISEKNVYYRLVQVDFDGTHNPCVPIMVNCKQQDEFFMVYPNPFAEYLNLKVNYSGKCCLEIVNQLGQIVYTNSVEIDRVMNLNLSDLIPSLYTLKIAIENGASYSVKIMKL